MEFKISNSLPNQAVKPGMQLGTVHQIKQYEMDKNLIVRFALILFTTIVLEVLFKKEIDFCCV